MRCELTSAASLAALRRLARQRPMGEESVVLVITAAARD
jgi:threonine synthase